MQQQTAFSYIELMLVITCLSLLAAATIPAWQQQQSGNHLLQAAETLAQDLRNARSLALIHNTPYFVHYDNASNHNSAYSSADSGTAWCYQLATHADCHCLEPSPEPDCQSTTYPTVNAEEFPGIYLSEALFGTQHYTRFEPVRGTARFGHLKLDDNFQRSLKINISMLGRIRICHPPGTIATGPYPSC